MTVHGMKRRTAQVVPLMFDHLRQQVSQRTAISDEEFSAATSLFIPKRVR
jgi:hypothetical protein